MAKHHVLTPLATLSQDHPRGARTHLGQDGLQRRGRWEEQKRLTRILCLFDPVQSLLARVQCLPCPKDGKRMTS